MVRIFSTFSSTKFRATATIIQITMILNIFITILFSILFQVLFPVSISALLILILLLVTVFKKYSTKPFAASRFQLDTNFDDRYEHFWHPYRQTLQKNKRGKKPSIKPSDNRISFDYDVCKALGINVTKKDLQELYTPIVNQMVTLQGLSKDD